MIANAMKMIPITIINALPNSISVKPVVPKNLNSISMRVFNHLVPTIPIAQS
jgi:hypothetical protein